METEFEKQQRQGAEYIEKRDQNIADQAKQKEYSDAYLQRQEELKQAGQAYLDQKENDQRGRGEGYQHIAQSSTIFSDLTPEKQKAFAQDFISANRDAETKALLTEYGIAQDGPSKPRDMQERGYQTPVDIAKTTNPASAMAQAAYERRMTFLTRDDQFNERIERAQDDPLKVERLTLERDIGREQYEMTTANAASNVSQLLKDEPNKTKFAAISDSHEANRDALVHKLAEFDKAHPQYRNEPEVNQPTPANVRGDEMSEAKELSENQKVLRAMQEETAKQSDIKTISPELKEMATQMRETIRVADQQRDLDRSKQREQER